MVCGLAITDLRWHAQMLAEQPVGPVNFWTPTPWKVNLTEGARFGFMLKAPVRRIGGFGHFVRYEECTVNDAWRRWGPANGVKTKQELASRITEFAKKRSVFALPDDPVIGCIVLSDCVFLEASDQLAPEAIGLSFPAPIVKWKRFQTELQLPLETGLPSRSVAFELVEAPDEDWESTRRRKRLAQPLFRRDVLAVYGWKCAVTESDYSDVLEAAHIQPFRSLASHHPQNGIALRRDIHRLFDRGLLTFENDGTLVLSQQLKGTSYEPLSGSKARFPLASSHRPSEHALAFHRVEIFRD